MKISTRMFAIAAAAVFALLLSSFMSPAEAGGRHGGKGYHGHHHSGHWARGHHGDWRGGHGGHWRGPRWRSGVSIGIRIGAGSLYYGAYGSPWWGYGYHPGYVVVAPPPVYVERAQRVERAPEPPLAKGPPDPIFYPKGGQSAEQREADLHDCNRWALEQPGAVAKADVFHRATLACMEGRGYSVR